MARALVGMNPKDENGNPMCYGFNLGTCDAVPPGQKCNKGWHKKMVPMSE